MVEKINTLIAFGTVLAQIAIIYGLYLILSKTQDKITEFVSKHAVLISLKIVAIATIGSIFYSSFLGYEPCLLCWWQRIFLFPQVIILAVAYYKKTKDALIYTLPLSIIGGMFAIYHTYIQYGGSEIIPCGTDINSVSCAVRYVFEFGYITIPLMSLTIFTLLIVIAIISKRTKIEGWANNL